jgi:hypothetical protein
MNVNLESEPWLRTRKQLTREQTRHVQRIHKTLEEGTAVPSTRSSLKTMSTL